MILGFRNLFYMDDVNVFWFRRDLRLKDNTGLNKALKGSLPVLAVFIFDKDIIQSLPLEDKRILFIHHFVSLIKSQLEKMGSSLLVFFDTTDNAFQKVISQYKVREVYANHDYEPYSIKRDNRISLFLAEKGIEFKTCKDQVIFEKSEVLKADGNPYLVFTPYSAKWKEKWMCQVYNTGDEAINGFLKAGPFTLPSPGDMGFAESSFKPERPVIDLTIIRNYHKHRDLPAKEGTTRLGAHLRFGTVSIRDLCHVAADNNIVFLNELIWREFFMSILFHFPQVQSQSFKSKYDKLEWRNDEEEFRRWCQGETGYPLVDAGMRELNDTGFMHNRVRMVTAGFLTKDLLIDWRWGEAYFAEKLLDYELSSNNGNWQWAAGTGCDAAPYFRIFNPEQQKRKFDPDEEYIRKWLPEAGRAFYPKPMVDHDMARKRALAAYKKFAY